MNRVGNSVAHLSILWRHFDCARPIERNALPPDVFAGNEGHGPFWRKSAADPLGPVDLTFCFKLPARAAALGGASFGFVLDSGDGGGLIAPAQ